MTVLANSGIKETKEALASAIEEIEGLEADQAKYQSLVESGIKFLQAKKSGACCASELAEFVAALGPFLPPPLLSEKLDKLADENKHRIELPRELRQLADEACELEVVLAIERESNEAFGDRIEVLHKENQQLKERMETGERKGMERAAKMAASHVHPEWGGKLTRECGNEIAEAIRRELEK